MKQAITVGCGSTNGRIIVDMLLEKGYNVTNIGNSEHPNATNITIGWNELDIPTLHKLLKVKTNIDFIFFNQNASSINSEDFDLSKIETLEMWKLIKGWQHSYWISCQLPIMLLHNLKNFIGPDTKIGWMLSSYLMYDCPGVEKYPDYSSQKYFNYLAMKCFGKHYQTFGIMPNFADPTSKNKMTNIFTEVLDNPTNCKIFNFNN
jgi:hypothetical protein